MVNRGVYDEIIEKMKVIYTHYPKCDFEASLNQLTNLQNSFDIKLVLVGHFSAGKSALLNALIGKTEFLKEAQEPQTAIATELIYDENESAFAYNVNGNKETINTRKEYAPNQYNHLEYRLNVSALKKINDFTIVDTPGFDAGIEAHARALANYIGRGSAYLVVIDQEKGGIDETTLEFLQELSNYSSQVAVLINKCDKITEEVAESIAESARCTLAAYGLPYKVYTVSKLDADISNKLISIILSFNAQAAFDKVMMKHIKAELLSTEKVLLATKKQIFLDTFDLDSDITRYSRLEEQLEGAFERKREEAKEELDNIVQEITNNIRSSLIAHADAVAEALLSGNQVAAEAIIVETIRPIMLATMQDISIRQIDNVTDALDFSGLTSDSERIDFTNIAVSLADSLKDLIERGFFDTRTAENIDKKKSVYRGLMGIAAIATDVVAPWLEVVVILLPDIINFFRGMFCESDNELAKRRFINNLVPQIINRSYPQIRQNVETTTRVILDEYEKLLTEKITSIKNNIAEAQNKKKQKIEDFENYKRMISEDIVLTQKLLNEVGETVWP